MQHPDEGTIHAWLDGALLPEEAVALEAHAAACGDCGAAVAEARGLIAASSRIVSALDTVPGGVIPQRGPIRPAWYATTQFRAAAAVLFVAGASMLLVQDRAPKSVEDLSRQVKGAPSAAAVEEQAADVADEVAAPTPVRAKEVQNGAKAAAANAPALKQPTPLAQAPLPQAMERSAVGATTGAAESRVALRESAPPANADFSGKGVGAQSQKVTVNDAAVAATATGGETGAFRVVSRDSTANMKTTIYLVQPGITVSLTETVSVPAMRTMTSTRRRESDAVAAPSVAVPPPPPVNQLEPGRLPIASVNWMDPVTKHVFTLSGPFSRAKLEEIRKQIELDQGHRR